ncbi:hypothetical protein SJI00_21380 [Pseudomonas sp. RP23018S]|nr:hypothetical protein [Pseudomonas sp. RP23018S]MDZ5605331.1 hypothetical protein [Pseudomonas sp. RP23018S]
MIIVTVIVVVTDENNLDGLIGIDCVDRSTRDIHNNSYSTW